MENFSRQVEIRWSDLDPNYHVRHSVYYDWAAYCRISFMNEYGATPTQMMQHQLGPIIFREECVFKKEIKFEDKIAVSLTLVKTTADFSRWTMLHHIWKNGDTLTALITVDGAWLDTANRKLTSPPAFVGQLFEVIPKAVNFEITDSK
jgi:acyl-CoA thioester hydrolase